MIAVLLLSLLNLHQGANLRQHTPLPGQRRPQADVSHQDRMLYRAAWKALLRGEKGIATTGFLLLAKRFKDSPLRPWALYYAGILNEVKGDFIAARRNYELAVQAGHPNRETLTTYNRWLLRGIQSGGPTLMRRWRALMTHTPRDQEWVARAETFLHKGKRLAWNSKLRLLLASNALQHQQIERASVHLFAVLQRGDKEEVQRALGALFPLLVNRGDLPALKRLAAAAGEKHPRIVQRVKVAMETIILVQRGSFLIWGLMLLLLLALLFPRRHRRHSWVFLLALLSLPLALLPRVGPLLALFFVHAFLLLWLYGERRPTWVKLLCGIYLLTLPVLGLVLTNQFPYTLLL